MKKLLSSLQMKNIDKKTINNIKISSLILMENAGHSVALEIIDEYKKTNKANILFLCGKGNNGGDGFVAARHLALKNIKTTVISTHKANELSNDALVMHNNLLHFNEIIYLEDLSYDSIFNIIDKNTIIIDAIFGTGIKSDINSPIKEIINYINSRDAKKIISIDVPSGICADTGIIYGTSIIAYKTITIASPKVGMYLYPAYSKCGQINVADISIPSSLINNAEHNINLITKNHVKNLLPSRISDSHKNSFGRCLVIAGSKYMPGAAILSAKPVMKTGCGFCTLITAEDNIKTISGSLPECVYINAPLDEQAIDTIVNEIDKNTSIVIGPGITVSVESINFIKHFLLRNQTKSLPFIFDADALNCLSLLKTFKLPVNSIITPHPSELAKLLEVETKDIMNNRIKYARLSSQKFNCITLLKGANTIISDKNGDIYINTTGNSSLATAGTGDVLSGILGGFTAQNNNILNMTILAVYLHGKCGEIASQNKNEYSVTAIDIIEAISNSINLLLT